MLGKGVKYPIFIFRPHKCEVQRSALCHMACLSPHARAAAARVKGRSIETRDARRRRRRLATRLPAKPLTTHMGLSTVYLWQLETFLTVNYVALNSMVLSRLLFVKAKV